MKKVIRNYAIMFFSLVAVNSVKAQCSGNSIVTSSRTLSTKLLMDSYQWVSCTSSLPIPGAIAKDYVVTVDGAYTVIVQIGSCRDTLGCVTIQGVGVDEIKTSKGLTIFPNPSSGHFIISSNYLRNITTVHIIDLLGRRVFEKEIRFDYNGQAMLETSLPIGSYFLFLRDEYGVSESVQLLFE